MDAPLTMDRLLALRRLTRALEETVRTQVREHLTTLAPLLRPRTVLGEFVQGAGKDTVLGAGRVWKELQDLYEATARKAPFNLARELRPPLEIPGTALEMAPLDYVHMAASDGGRKRVVVTRPCEWILSYSAHGPARMRELLADPNRDAIELQRCVALALVLHLVFTHQPSIGKVFADLRMPVASRRLPGFGELPLVVLGPVVPTLLVSDELVVASTEMTGADAFQEVVDVAAVTALGDPFRTRLLEVLARHGETPAA